MATEKIEKLLKKHNQSHLLAFWGQLDAVQRQNLLVQVEKLDFSEIEGWVANFISENAMKELRITLPCDVWLNAGLKSSHRIWKDRTTYNEQLHQANQKRNRSHAA